MEIEVVEPPKKVIVDKDLRLRALREHRDDKRIQSIHRHPSGPKPSRCVRFICYRIQRLGAVVLTDCVAPLDSSFLNCERKDLIDKPGQLFIARSCIRARTLLPYTATVLIR
jgi:hypothetical protein